MNHCPICNVRLDTPLDFQMHGCSKRDKERALKLAQEVEKTKNSISLDVSLNLEEAEVPLIVK